MAKKVSGFSAIFSSGLQCCFCCLSRPLSKDPNFGKKRCFFLFWKTAYQNHKNGAKKESLKNKHGLMLFGKKKHQITARDIN